ncbi:MAG: pyridoxal-phosphate dependent enzyme [Bryobacteraceae bacterium]|nr:pyridoxal-phosphate dependent enzyme [Bryobacteraceae bacterium]
MDHRLSLGRIEKAARVIDPVFRGTPQYRAEVLEGPLGCGALTLKIETMNPIGSFKGRGTDFLLTEMGERRPLVCASAGNFGQGLAYAGRRQGVRVTVFAAETANPKKIARMRALGAEVRLAGADFDAAKEAARGYAESSGDWYVEDGREVAIAEGAGSIAVELARIEEYDELLVPVGNGALITGIGRWMKEVRPAVRIVGVCAAGAPSMKRSFEARRVIETERASTMADGIAVRAPVPEAVRDMEGVVDEVVLVSEDSLAGAMELLEREAGLIAEPAGAAGIATMIEDPARWRGARVATILCGANRRG